MITEPTLNDGAANHIYSRQTLSGSKPNKWGSQFSEAAAAADQPAGFSILHQVIGTGINTRHRDSVQFTRVVEDADGNQGTIVRTVTEDYPVKIATAAQLDKTNAECVAFHAIAGRVAEIRAGEV